MNDQSARGPFFDHSPLLQAVLTPTGEFVEWNEVWAQYGIAPAGQSFLQFVADERAVHAAWHDLAGASQVRLTARLRGTTTLQDVDWTFVRDPAADEALCVIGQPQQRSTPDSSELEAIRYDASRTLLSAITHNCNNLLTPIVTLSEVILRQLPQQDAWHPHVELIHQSGVRISALLRQLRSFFPPTGDLAQPQEVDLRALLLQTLEVWRGQAPDNSQSQLQVTTDLAEVSPVSGSPEELQQAFLQILDNARDAIQTTNSDDGQLSVRLAQDDRDAVICIQDDGCGMTPEIRLHCFDPFYTTKPQAEGIGLCVTCGVLQRHRGKIEIQSRVAEGTTVVLRLPRPSP